MIPRRLEKQLAIALKRFPAVGLIGPRQCGKTTLARQMQKAWKKDAVYYDLESPADFRKFDDAEWFLQQQDAGHIILDEIQRKPELFAILRSLIDRKRTAGRFLLLGSASPELIRGTSESLAGRIVYLEAHPFNITEIKNTRVMTARHWLRGGFPGSFLARNDAAYFQWMDAFSRTYIERDLNNLFGTSFSVSVMFRLWRMLAHHHGSLWNSHSFSKGLDIAPGTANRYLDFLEGAFLIRKLSPYHFNIRKRLVKSPKVYLRDSGLLHYLLDIQKSTQLVNHPSVGYSWEGYVMEQILQLLPSGIQPYFYRTHDGSELDLVLVKGLKPIAGIEIKFSTNPKVTRGMLESVNDLRCKKNYILIPGESNPFRLNKTFLVCGLRHFLEKELPLIIK